jgi:DNA-binding MarR family transcriptional regulator
VVSKRRIAIYIEDFSDFGLSETERLSLLALQEHSPKLVFESRSQAARLLRRARELDRYTASEHAMLFWGRGLIKIDRKEKEELQPWLFELAPVETRHGRRAQPKLNKI